MADSGDPILKQQDLLASVKAYAPMHKQGAAKDMLAGRWHILFNQPLPGLSSSYAKAYAARDDKTPGAELYALVYEDGVPLRQKNIQALKNVRHPNLVSLLADGMAQADQASQLRYAVVLEKPQGRPLSEMFARRRDPMSETLLIQRFLRPLAQILVEFAKLGISHNRIHPGNIYLNGKTVILGECVSEPSGFSQENLFEPVDRMQTSPRAKADFSTGADCYALAMLALHFALGFTPFKSADKENLIRALLNKGAYHTFIMPWDLPPGLQDFLRGMLGDGHRDHWDTAMLENWLSGRRFNLVMPPSASETTRGFEFHGESHFTCRSLAHGLWRHWKDALPLADGSQIARWLKMHVHKQDIADAVSRIAYTGSAFAKQQEDEVLARIIMVLDPKGPLRFRHISIAPEAAGAELAYALIADRREDVSSMVQIFEADLPGFWIEQQKRTFESAVLGTKLQKVRANIRMKDSGFGMERLLYDLNPGIPCLSPLLKGHVVTTLAEVLAALDAVSPQKAGEEVGDSHIAAFVASRLNLNKDIQLTEFHSLPTLKNHPTLRMLKLLSKAQSKTRENTFKGLSLWLVIRLLPLLDTLHSREARRRLQAALRAAANKGSVEAIAEVMFASSAFEDDLRGFHKATADYAMLKKRIAMLGNSSRISFQANMSGHGIAQSLAYGICLGTVYAALKSYFQL